jgi:hypothetical protein
VYGLVRGRSIRRRTVRWRPCSGLTGLGLRLAGLRLRLAGLCLHWARVGGARRLCLCWPRLRGCWARVSWRRACRLGTCRRLLGTSGVGSSGFCCRCRTIAGLRFRALVRAGLAVVLRLWTILGVRRGWQRPDETTGETAEG